jgi:hypothetical protein
MDKKLIEALHKIGAMAFTRDKWIDKACQRMEGALGEYAKLKFAMMASFPDYWSDEVKSLMEQVEELFDPKKVATKQKFDRIKAFDEAIRDSIGCQEQITSARNEFIRYLTTSDERQAFLKKSHQARLRSEDLLIELLSEYLPENIVKKLTTVR